MTSGTALAAADRPVPAVGHMPFPGSKTLAQIHGSEAFCPRCDQWRQTLCSSADCGLKTNRFAYRDSADQIYLARGC